MNFFGLSEKVQCNYSVSHSPSMILTLKDDIQDEDFRINQFWEYKVEQKVTQGISILNEIRRRLEYIESGQLIPPKDDFSDFIKSFQDFCFSCPQKLTELVQPNHIDILFDSLLLEGISDDHRIELLNSLFILAKDADIRNYLYEDKQLLPILFELYNTNPSYFIQICNILGAYLNPDSKDEDVFKAIIKSKIHSYFDKDEISFFKEVIRMIDDVDCDNYDFAHAALFFISKIIPFNLDDKHLCTISNSLTNRLILHKYGDKEISDIVYCFCCFIKNYPTKTIIFSNTKIIGCFPFIFSSFSDDSKKLIRFSMYLMNMLSVDGTHISYFEQTPDTFLILLSNLSNFTNLTTKCVLAGLKALYNGVRRIPPIANLLVDNGLLVFLYQLNDVAIFSIKEVILQLLSLVLKSVAPEYVPDIINDQCYMSILEDIKSYSCDLSLILLKSTLFVIESLSDLTSINQQFASTFEALSTENDDLGPISQTICEIFFSKVST